MGQAEDSVSFGSQTKQFETTRRQAKAQVKGDWSWSDWRLTPHAAIESTGEIASGPAGLADTTAGSDRISAGPRLSRQIDLNGKTRLEPFVHMNSSVDLDMAGTMLRGGDAGEPHRVIGGGLALSQTDEYRFEATADLDDPGNGAESEVRGGMKLTIPLR
jgi:hypothetical protein